MSEENKKAAEEAARITAQEAAAKEAGRKAAEEASRQATEAQRVRLSEIKNREDLTKRAMPTKDSLPPIKPKDEPKRE